MAVSSIRLLQHALVAGVACVAAGSHTSLAKEASGERPNIIFIMADDHAAHAMSCYGSKVNKTPNLDRLATEGIRFRNAFCTNSICAPSRATILTGQYSHVNGVLDNRQAFDGNRITFPKLLQQAGYQTALIGKWHLKSDPTGFDYWKVLPGQGAYHNPSFIEMGRRTKQSGYVTDIITDDCIKWLQQRDGDRPFCLVYHHKAPHRRWQPDEKHARLYEDVAIPEPPTFNDDYKTRSDAAREQAMAVDRDLSKEDLKVPPPEGLTGPALKRWKYQRYMQDYLRCVASIDDNVGRLLNYLDEAGLTENTVVFYTSDQGFFLGDHGWYDKRFMYEEALRMPLVVRYPKKLKPGTVNDDLVLNVDFAPTILDFAGVKPPDAMQGRSLRRVMLGDKPENWRTSVYYHYYEFPGWHSVKRHYGVRTQRYKLIHFYYDIDAWELYDLENDPNELKNLYADPEHAEIIRRLEAELRRLQKQYGDSDELAREILERDLSKARAGNKNTTK